MTFKMFKPSTTCLMGIVEDTCTPSGLSRRPRVGGDMISKAPAILHQSWPQETPWHGPQCDLTVNLNILLIPLTICQHACMRVMYFLYHLFMPIYKCIHLCIETIRWTTLVCVCARAHSMIFYVMYTYPRHLEYKSQPALVLPELGCTSSCPQPFDLQILQALKVGIQQNNMSSMCRALLPACSHPRCASWLRVPLQPQKQL